LRSSAINVDRVEDPARRGVVAAGDPELLAHDGLPLALGEDRLPQRLLRRAVGHRHRRQVGLRLDRQRTRPEVPHRDLVGEVGQRERKCQVGAHASIV
jgi:hypothetical protein